MIIAFPFICLIIYSLTTVPSVNVILYPLKLILPLLFNFEIFTSPVRFHVAPSSTVTSALLSTAVPFSELSTIFTVPLNSVEPDNVNFNVEIVSTSILPSSF